MLQPYLSRWYCQGGNPILEPINIATILEPINIARALTVMELNVHTTLATSWDGYDRFVGVVAVMLGFAVVYASIPGLGPDPVWPDLKTFEQWQLAEALLDLFLMRDASSMIPKPGPIDGVVTHDVQVQH
jgi:hypothetical protein